MYIANSSCPIYSKEQFTEKWLICYRLAVLACETLFQLQTPQFLKFLLFAAVCKEHLKIFFRVFDLSESGFSVRKQTFGAELPLTNLPGVLHTGGIPTVV